MIWTPGSGNHGAQTRGTHCWAACDWKMRHMKALLKAHGECNQVWIWEPDACVRIKQRLVQHPFFSPASHQCRPSVSTPKDSCDTGRCHPVTVKGGLDWICSPNFGLSLDLDNTEMWEVNQGLELSPFFCLPHPTCHISNNWHFKCFFLYICCSTSLKMCFFFTIFWRSCVDFYFMQLLWMLSRSPMWYKVWKHLQ